MNSHTNETKSLNPNIGEEKVPWVIKIVQGSWVIKVFQGILYTIFTILLIYGVVNLISGQFKVASFDLNPLSQVDIERGLGGVLEAQYNNLIIYGILTFFSMLSISLTYELEFRALAEISALMTAIGLVFYYIM